MHLRTLVAASALVLLSAAGYAQDFPEGAKAPNAAELKALMVDKVFDVKTARGAWRYEVKSNGYFFLNIAANNYSDSGEWRTEDGRFCTKPQKTAASCNEMRVVGSGLFMKRDNGEIVQFTPR